MRSSGLPLDMRWKEGVEKRIRLHWTRQETQTGRLMSWQLVLTVPSLLGLNSLVFVLRPTQADRDKSHLLGQGTMKSFSKYLDKERGRASSQDRPQKTVKEKLDLSSEPTLLAPLLSQDPSFHLYGTSPSSQCSPFVPKMPRCLHLWSLIGPPTPSQVTSTAFGLTFLLQPTFFQGQLPNH